MNSPPLLEIDDVSDLALEMEFCRRNPIDCIDLYFQVKDDIAAADPGQLTAAGWRPFQLWPAQRQALAEILPNRQVIVLKARQLGWTWLILALALHLLRFNPGSTVLLFSAREDEAKELLRRLRGMYERLPEWLRLPGKASETTTELLLPNASRAMCFPGTAGHSYTASMVLIDEADKLRPPADLSTLLNAVKPTVDAGGKLFLISTPEKSKPESRFKSMYRAAKSNLNGFLHIFQSWQARPSRTQQWYDAEARRIMAETGSLDDLHQEYPATEEEALAPRSLDKRIPPEWCSQCYVEAGAVLVDPVVHPRPPVLPGLTIYRLPAKWQRYACGADPAEGNPTSDESAACWLDCKTGEQVALLAGRLEPGTFAGYIKTVSDYYHGCSVLVERNNHGHAVLLALDELGNRLLCGADGKRGWPTTAKTKAELWTVAAEALRYRQTILHDFTTLLQLMSIDGSTLKAPEGQHDDRAVMLALAVLAVNKLASQGGLFMPFAV